MTVQEAYSIVLNDMLNSECGMFVGNYDAKNGSDEFMYGISTVMEYIAYKVYDEENDTVEDYEGFQAESVEDQFDQKMKENDGMIVVSA